MIRCAGLLLSLLSAVSLAEPMFVPWTANSPTIDALAVEEAWDTASWRPIDKLLMGERPTPGDFSGRFKILWRDSRLFLLIEIVDDTLVDSHADPLQNYWQDDCVEIFIDEDHSGGPHGASYNAFAYHVALDGQVVDADRNGRPRLYNDHVESSWRRGADAIIWELAVTVYPEDYDDDQTEIAAVVLSSGQSLGFMLAYCDADGAGIRESFVSSHDVAPVNGDRNRGYLDADVFGEIVLQGPGTHDNSPQQVP